MNCSQYKHVDEFYTSKMCSVCGTIDEKLGKSKIYNCKNCGLKIERDFNGARWILIKSIR
jgi:Putative transposase DNA-binding domain.